MKIKHFYLFSAVALLALSGSYLSALLSAGAQTAGGITPLSGYAWGSNDSSAPLGGIGWISFNYKNCDTNGDDVLDSNNPACLPESGDSAVRSKYKVYINQTTDPVRNGELYGYAWSSNYGWIKFGPGEGLPRDIADAPTADGNVKKWAYLQTMSGNDFSASMLRGWARVCSVFATGCEGALAGPEKLGGWDGWISMSGLTDGVEYGVRYDRNVNQFKGFAWGGGDASVQSPGWIRFSYPVATGPSSGPHCFNGVKDADEAGIDCGGADCPACDGGCHGPSCGGNPPQQGFDPVYPSGVTVGDPKTGGFNVHCVPYSNGIPVTSVAVGQLVEWKVDKLGGVTNASPSEYSYLWNENHNEVFSTLTKQYLEPGKVKENATVTVRTFTDTCPDTWLDIYNPAESVLTINADPNSYKLTTTDDPMKVSPTVFAGYTGPECTGSASLSLVEITKTGNGVQPTIGDYALTSTDNSVVIGDPVGKTLEITLKGDTYIWKGTYKATIMGTGGSCSGSATDDITIRIGAPGEGIFIEI